MKSLSEALKLGIQKSAVPLTVSLQQSATNLGWDTNATKRVRVRPNGETKLAVNAQGTAPESAEYGGLDEQPRPAIRQWAADESTVDSILVYSIMAELEGVKI